MQRQDIYLLTKRRKEARQKPSRSRNRFLGALARTALALFSLLFCAALIAGGYSYASLTHDLPSVQQLPLLLDRQNGELLQPTRLMDRSSTQTLAIIGNPGITPQFLSVNPDDPDHFSLQLIRLTVAALDPTFWTNNGTSNLFSSDPQPHTIAEKLVKDLLLSNEKDSLRTTFRMKLLASQLVHTYGRTQILEWYLNSVYLGHLAYGADSASQLYFHKSAAQLDLAESVLIVSLMNSPALNPIDAKTAALENQKNLLQSLAQAGSISPDEYQSSAAEKLQLYSAAPAENPNSDFIQLVEDQLESELGKERVERGGLIVTTTLDSDLQAQLLCAAQGQLSQIQTSTSSGVAIENLNCPASALLPTQNFSWNGQGLLGAAGVIANPQTGQVLAYSAPISLNGNSFQPDYQPGSLLSPFVALAAFARGTSPASLQWDVPTSLPADLAGETNPDGQFHGAANVRLALANDYLVPFASLLEQMDSSTVWSLANAVGLSSPQLESAPASWLFGGGKSSLTEIARAYATLADEGNRAGTLNTKTGQVDLVFVLKAETISGQELVNHTTAESQAILSRSLTYLINNVLSDEAARWTSLGHPNVLEIGKTAAVKIGQVASKDQVWTVGYTPDRLVLTWVGEDSSTDQNAPLDALMSAGFWHALIQYSTQDLPDHNWSQPADVTTVQVCSPSGMLPTAICPNITNDVFLNGNEPTQPDNLFVKLSVNRETGLLATVFTPPDLVEDKVFMDVPVNVRAWAASAGVEIPPLGYDAIATTQINPSVQITSPTMFAPVSGKVIISGTANIDSFASYYVQVGQGINPQSWQQVGVTGSAPVTNGQLAVWDTTGLDGLYAVRLTVVDQQNQIQTATIQVTVDNIPPGVKITYPAAGSQVKPSNGTLTLSADITDDVGVASVTWWIDGKKVGESIQPPYALLWNAAVGNHTLQVKAADTAGNLANSQIINFTVLP